VPADIAHINPAVQVLQHKTLIKVKYNQQSLLQAIWTQIILPHFHFPKHLLKKSAHMTADIPKLV